VAPLRDALLNEDSRAGDGLLACAVRRNANIRFFRSPALTKRYPRRYARPAGKTDSIAAKVWHSELDVQMSAIPGQARQGGLVFGVRQRRNSKTVLEVNI